MNENTINADVTLGGAEGTLLANRYRVVRQLGQGGMGSVWLAEDTQLDNREVAIKMLPSILVSNKRAYNQLKAEALVSLKLTHPNIATVRAFEENNGNPFLVVDYIDGLTLDEYLGRKGRLTEEATASILLPVAAALDYAHEKGIVHRDVKPGNVMVTWDGVPYVLDFGIAREMQETMTRVTGKLSSGTLLYMSPEQLRGASPKAAQDIYSFSALAYECLTGHPPFSRGQVEYQILNEPPEPLPESIVMGRRVMGGLAKDPKDRPSSCRVIMKDWRAAFGMSQTEPEPPHEPPPSKPPPEPRQAEPDSVQTDESPQAASGAGTLREPTRHRFLAPIVFLALALLALFVVVANRRAASPSAPPNAASVEMDKPTGLDSEYIDVGVLIGRVERLESSGGFGARIDQVRDDYRRAQTHFELRQWREAERLFAGVRRDSEKLLAEDADRQRALLPKLRLVAKVDGREVTGAKVTVGGRTYETPVELGSVAKQSVQGPFDVSYTENYRLYEGQFKGITVDWQGTKTWSFALKEHVFPKAGERKVVSLPNGAKMAFRWCPAGEFTMGSPIDEDGRFLEEQQHLVKLPNGFWMGETEVTQGQWKELMGGATVVDQARKALKEDWCYLIDGKRQTYRDWWQKNRDDDVADRCGSIRDELPVYFVSWFESVEFCRRLNARELAAKRLPDGFVYRLPSEAEWEYACRAGITAALPNGSDISIMDARNAPALDEIAWYGGNSSVGFTGIGWNTAPWEGKQYAGGLAGPRVVAQKSANAWGLCDMLGNVGEWCGDWVVQYSGEAFDPLGPQVGERRVNRGGSWSREARFCRPACRFGDPPGMRFNSIGFRVALAPIHDDWPFQPSSVGNAIRSTAPDKVYERKHEEPKPEAAPTKPTLLLSTTLNGVPVKARVVEGLVESDAKTPTTVTLNNPIGTDWNYTIEYDAGLSIYRTEGSFRTRSGRHELTVRLEEGSQRPSSLNFCRHCRASLSDYVTIGTRCPSCHKNLYGD